MSSELIWQVTKKHNALIVNNGSLTSFDKDPLNLTNVPSKKASGLANPKAVGVAAGKNGAVLLVKNRRAGNSKPAKLTTGYTVKSVRGGAKVVKGQLKSYRKDLVPAALARLTRVVKTSKASKPAAK